MNRALLLAIPMPLVFAVTHLRRVEPVHEHHREHVTTNTVVTVVTPLVIAMPVAAPPVFVEEACPAPRPRARPAKTLATLPERVTHVEVAPSNGHWIVAWNESSGYASWDGGATFAPVLDGTSSPLGELHSMQFDCFGNVIAARDRVGVRDGATGVESWIDLPYLHGVRAQVVGGGPDIVVVGNRIDPDDDLGFAMNTSFAITSDRGASWRFVDHHDYFQSHLRGRQRADRTIDITLEVLDCTSEDYYRIVIAPDNTLRSTLVDAPPDPAWDIDDNGQVRRTPDDNSR